MDDPQLETVGLGVVDTHCHLGHGDEPPSALVERAQRAGIRRLIDVGIDAATTVAARQRARTLPGVVFTAGLHPCEAGRIGEDWAEIVAASADPRCVALGETGFDFHWDRASPAAQAEAFERHLDLAARIGKPVVVHCREAFDATFATLAAHPQVRTVLHCFSGGLAEARRALDLGCFLSFAGPLTYPRAAPLREAAAFAPVDRILVETDAPFLPPQGRRGQRNEPAFVVAVLEALASARGLRRVELAAQTTATARAVFGPGLD
jgi:TatD DNase family protein